MLEKDFSHIHFTENIYKGEILGHTFLLIT